MADLIKTKATYAKLAEELLTAQTTLTKQEILVKGLFKSIVKKKIEIIEDRLVENTLKSEARNIP